MAKDVAGTPAIPVLLASIGVIRGQSSTAYTGEILAGGVSRYFCEQRDLLPANHANARVWRRALENALLLALFAIFAGTLPRHVPERIWR